MQIDGSGRVHLVQSMPVLRPDEQVLQMMLDGWRNQQLSRNLQFGTIDQRIRCVQVRGPRERVSVALDAGDGRGVSRGSALDPARDPLDAPGLPVRAPPVHLLRHQPRLRLGPALRAALRHPSRAGFLRLEHCPACPGVRRPPDETPLHQDELQRSSTMPTTRSNASESGRKGWQAAYRDAVMLKVAYSYGLRFNELRHLQTVDFATNPHARSSEASVLQGPLRQVPKGVTAQAAQRPDGLRLDCRHHRGLARQRPRLPHTLDLFPSERGGLIVESTLLRRLRRYWTSWTPPGRAGPAFTATLLRHAPAGRRMGS